MVVAVRPEKALPHDDSFDTVEDYVDSLLSFVGTNDLLRVLCGGVHILDFFTKEPDLYSTVIPSEWQDFFAAHDILSILDILMRHPLDSEQEHGGSSSDASRNQVQSPPSTLVDYISAVRRHSLNRQPSQGHGNRDSKPKAVPGISRHVAVGMNVKKVHEVALFASYVDRLVASVSMDTGQDVSHLVDFGSGQNYLGRVLASKPYNRRVVAIESKTHNAERARELDVLSHLVPKDKIMRNKKTYRAGVEQSDEVAVQCISNMLPLGGSVAPEPEDKGTVAYVEHRIQDGQLAYAISQIPQPDPSLLVISLHSCGNLVHHGLRSLVLNPAVKAVAMVGCCYNLVTERLGPATYKLPELRPPTSKHPRVERLGQAYDPHGFPMSHRLCGYDNGQGLRLNITARMMAVQAPQNWGPKDSETFFTRHFYRALLQRVFLDYGVVGPPSQGCVGGSPVGHSSGTPIVIGSLRKSCYTSFVTYVHGALAKLTDSPDLGSLIRERMLSVPDEEIERYEELYKDRKKDLSIIWSLMAFSAGVIEATIVVDRWLWMKETPIVRDAWVESVFDYRVSPRNLVLVGVK